MFRKTLSFSRALIVAITVALFLTGTSQAAQPVGGSRPGMGFQTGGGRPGGGGSHPNRPRFVLVSPWWWYGNSYGYYSPEYAYAMAVQQNQAALLDQQWYRLRQEHAADVRDRQAQALAARDQAKLEPQVVQRRAPASPPADLTPEARASAKFKLAMILADEGQRADAAEYCRDILKKYAGTAAAREAQRFLDQNNRR